MKCLLFILFTAISFSLKFEASKTNSIRDVLDAIRHKDAGNLQNSTNQSTTVLSQYQLGSISNDTTSPNVSVSQTTDRSSSISVSAKSQASSTQISSGSLVIRSESSFFTI